MTRAISIPARRSRTCRCRWRRRRARTRSSEFGRPNIEQMIAAHPIETPLAADAMVVAFKLWDERSAAQATLKGTSWPSARAFQELRLDRLGRAFGGVRRCRTSISRSAGRVRRPARPFRLRQVDGAQLHRRAAARYRRRIWLDDRRIDKLRARGARLRHGVPELRAVPAYERAQKCRLRPGDARVAAGRRSQRRSTRPWPWCASSGQAHKLPASCRVASSSASPSRAPSSSSRRWC